MLFSSCFGPVDPSQTQDIEKRPILRTSHAHSGVAVIEPLLSDFMSKKCPPHSRGIMAGLNSGTLRESKSEILKVGS